MKLPGRNVLLTICHGEFLLDGNFQLKEPALAGPELSL